MRSGAFERHLNRMRAQYKGKHDLLIRLLKDLGRDYTVSGENAGVHVLVHLPKGLSEADAVQRAKKAGVRVYGLERYCISNAAWEQKMQKSAGKSDAEAGEEKENKDTRKKEEKKEAVSGGTVLLGYAGLSEKEITEAVEILRECWNR